MQRNGSHELQIDIATPPSGAFWPGDIITGTISRQAPIVAPNAMVTVLLLGRVKTKIVKEHHTEEGRRIEQHRGRWFLMDDYTIQTLHQGPVHLPPGQDCLSWPFSITLPTHADVSLLTRDHFEAESYLRLDNVADHGLPGTFFSSSIGWTGTGSECYVEYYLESSLLYHHGSSHENCKATFPIYVQHPQWGPLSHELHQRTFQHKIHTQRLLPGMEHAELSFKQKTQKLFGSSKVPTFTFNVKVSCPREVQLENPSPFSLVIEISPDPNKISPNIRDTPQKIQLDCIEMVLKSTTDLTAPVGHLFKGVDEEEHKCHYDLGLPAMFRRLEKPIVFEITKESEQVDIGALFQLVFHPDGLHSGSNRVKCVDTIYPDFITYNIKHVYSIEWEFSFTVADETEKKKAITPIKILPPSRENLNPPAYFLQ
jgi:hypothetical protein